MTETEETIVKVQLDSDETSSASTVVRLRCPICGRNGTFDPVTEHDLRLNRRHKTKPVTILGHRRCPSDDCHAHIFFIYERGQVIATYPPERIDFDKTGIPVNVTSTFEEALACHANRCYTASAMMIRRTLEEVCSDREAKGKDLFARIEALGEQVVLPKQLLDAMHSLRLLGNDAAHVEARTFEHVSRLEVETGIAVTKEILKAVYQYANLIGQLEALKRQMNQNS